MVNKNKYRTKILEEITLIINSKEEITDEFAVNLNEEIVNKVMEL